MFSCFYARCPTTSPLMGPQLVPQSTLGVRAVMVVFGGLMSLGVEGDLEKG